MELQDIHNIGDLTNYIMTLPLIWIIIVLAILVLLLAFK